MQLIYNRTQSEPFNLSQDARAYLCLGILWSGSQQHIAFNTVESMVQDIVPEIDGSLLCRKLYNEWGIWYAKNKHDKLAEEKFLTVIAHDRQQIPARTELGRLLSRQKGREAEAEHFLREILTIDPQNIQSRTELGRLLSRQKGREAEAEYFLREVLTIDPRNLHARTVLAKLYEKMNRISDARKLYQELCEIDPGDRFGQEGLARLKP